MRSTGVLPATSGIAVPPMLRLSTRELPPATGDPATHVTVCCDDTAPTAMGDGAADRAGDAVDAGRGADDARGADACRPSGSRP